MVQSGEGEGYGVCTQCRESESKWGTQCAQDGGGTAVSRHEQWGGRALRLLLLLVRMRRGRKYREALCVNQVRGHIHVIYIFMLLVIGRCARRDDIVLRHDACMRSLDSLNKSGIPVYRYVVPAILALPEK